MTKPPRHPDEPLPVSSAVPLINDFRTLDARKTRTRRGRIGTSCPVFGFRPIRCPLSRTCLLYTSDAADERSSVDLGGRCFIFQAEDGIRDAQESRGLGDVYKRQTRRGRIGTSCPVFGFRPIRCPLSR